MPVIRADPSAAPRLQDWVRVEQVVTGETVDVGFDDHHPKEPAAAYHDGTVYLACAVWDAYAFPPTDKEVALCVADDPAGEFAQISQVTDEAGVISHAPGVLVEDGDLWVLYSRGSTDEVANDIYAKRAPVSDIPDDPDGWTDEGKIFADARDPGVLQDADGRYHLVAKDEQGPGVVHVDGPRLTALSRDEGRTMYTNSFGEAPDLVPKASGEGYWLVTAEGVGEGPRMSVAGEAASPAEEFRGYYVLGTHRSLNGVSEPFHSQWTLHHDYLHADAGRALYRQHGEVMAYFEGGDGSQFSVGVGFLRDGDCRGNGP
jgi:hypothetical protein